MEQFAGYGFNKSHSAAYAWLAYQTAYLKANHPAFFMAALLTSERANTDKMVQYIGECREMGIQVLPPDLNQSDMYFTVVPGRTEPKRGGEGGLDSLAPGVAASEPSSGLDAIRFGLSAIKNVGEGAVEAILEVRRKSAAFSSLFDFCERVDMKAVNRRVIESFVKSGCFDSLDPRRASLLAAIDQAMEAGQKLQRDREKGQGSLLGMWGGLEPGPKKAPLIRELPEWGEGERLAFEKESLGFFITGHPLERFREELARWATTTIGRLGEFAEREVAVGGIITGLRLIKTKKGDRMASFVLEDLEGGAEVLVFPETYKKVVARLAEDQVVLVRGKAEKEDEGKARLLATDVLTLEQAQLTLARSVTIRVPLGRWDRTTGERLRDILGSHRGDCPVTLEMVRPGAYSVAVAPNAAFKVRPNTALQSDIEALLGPGALSLAGSENAPREGL
jgi:DNA polymerase-3 subunit alpha